MRRMNLLMKLVNDLSTKYEKWKLINIDFDTDPVTALIESNGVEQKVVVSEKEIFYV